MFTSTHTLNETFKKLITALVAFILCHASVLAQSDQWNNVEHRLFQFSIVPGMGSNGLNPGSFINHFSLNLTSGYSAGTKGIEVGIISNLNEEITRGFQFAGIANFTGANAFAGMSNKEALKKRNSGFEANMHGGQFAGFANLVVDNAFGVQLTGGFNVVKNALFGFQLAGISNFVEGYSFAFQLAGLSNVSVKAIDGVQIALLYNGTKGQLQGIQLGAFNKSGRIEGKNSLHNSDDVSGLQLGLVNFSKKMNGFQVGIINYGGRMQGTQLGLINIYNGGKEMGTRDGTSIGLLNVGDILNIKVFANELFSTNYSLTTGTGKNYRLRTKPVTVYILNEIIFGYNPKLVVDDNRLWSIGYGLTYAIYNRSSVPSQGEKRFAELSAQIHHFERGDRLDDLNLFSKISANVGSRIHPKLSWLYFFLGGSFNINHSADIESYISSSESEEIRPGTDNWLGFQAGLLVH